MVSLIHSPVTIPILRYFLTSKNNIQEIMSTIIIIIIKLQTGLEIVLLSKRNIIKML